MSGNKHNNGVHEIGTPETLRAYQEDTPGQMVERYLEEAKKKNDDVKAKLHFGQKFDNPLKGFPYNESVNEGAEVYTMKKGSFTRKVDGKEADKMKKQGWKLVAREDIQEASLQQLKRKHKRHIDAFNKRNKDLPANVEKDLMKFAMDNDGIGDDPDDFDDWLVQNIEEAQSPAQQAAIAISKKEKGEKPLEEDSFEDKSKKSGISVGTLKKVYKRGVAAWKTGHRPGTTPEQWGHARVNAFIVKKKKGNLNHDKDLA